MPATPTSFFPQTHFVDDDLELIPPDAKWVDAILRECADKRTQEMDPRLSQTTRESLAEFLHAVPAGRVQADLTRGQLPAYHFWIRWRDPITRRFRMAGGIGIRIGSTPEIELFSGHIGYHIYPTARGRHFAERACRMIVPLLQFHAISPVWITCNPDNLASRRTCERLGARYVETVEIPVAHPFFARGERQKCRYRWDIAAGSGFRVSGSEG